ncbi:MAG: hypothetical protein E6Q83_14765 [Thiothrix sp.]|nr:MAG: hypothetical protein E6Q83_14765 [Thiothrix sp.]
MIEDMILDSHESGVSNDKLIKKITNKTLNSNNISFDLIRNHGREENNVKNELQWGRAILATQEQLNQYLHTYGLMIKSQWINVLSSFELEDRNVQIIDYACGQGLACSLFFDKFLQQEELEVRQITLIEPSAIALRRAYAIVKCYNENHNINCINLKLDDLKDNYLRANGNSTYIHLFSNILDINTFDIFKLFRKIIGKRGKHVFLAVSHDRDFDGGAPRLEELHSAFVYEKNAHFFKKVSSEIRRFNCENGMPAICLNIQVEI